MSFRVLVVPEDPTYNGYILKPLAERMVAEAGRPNAQVQLLVNPKVQGYDDAVRAIRGQLADRYGYYDLWLFLPDADRSGDLAALECELGRKSITLRCCKAVPEVEAWLLAGHRDKLDVSWQVVRGHTQLREEVFEPFLARHGDARSAGGGRGALMRETLQNYRGLLEVCPELAELEKRIREIAGMAR